MCAIPQSNSGSEIDLGRIGEEELNKCTVLLIIFGEAEKLFSCSKQLDGYLLHWLSDPKAQ